MFDLFPGTILVFKGTTDSLLNLMKRLRICQTIL